MKPDLLPPDDQEKSTDASKPVISATQNSPDQKFWQRPKVIIPFVALIVLYFSGILGFSFYLVKCGNPPTIKDFYTSERYYTGDAEYFIKMPFTSLLIFDKYACTDVSPFPGVRAREDAARKKAEADRQEAAKQVAFAGLPVNIYEVKSGTVPDMSNTGEVQLSSQDGGRITETYINTKTNKESRVVQRKKVTTIADHAVCGPFLRRQQKDPNYERDNNFCGEFTPKGLRVYNINDLSSNTKGDPDYVVDMGNTQILIDADAFLGSPVSAGTGNLHLPMDKAKLYAFIDQLSPLTPEAKKALYNRASFYL